MKRHLTTTRVESARDSVAFFDRLARDHYDHHGDGNVLLRYRCAVIRGLIGPTRGRTVLELGCGPADHLFALADDAALRYGIDFSDGMVSAANEKAARLGLTERTRIYRADAAETWELPDATCDTVFCVGAFEHMSKKTRVLKNVVRMLRPGGVFVCLTGNGAHLWHSIIGPAIRLDTRHLSTDHFVTASGFKHRAKAAGLWNITTGSWSFVPAGDMSPGLAAALRSLERIGAVLRFPVFCGGLWLRGEKSLLGDLRSSPDRTSDRE